MQAKWRAACTVVILAAAAMAWYGTEAEFPRSSPAAFAVYWGVFLMLMVVILFIVVLDLRYIRLQYVLARRELYRQAFEDEAFRQALLGAKEQRPSRMTGENAEERNP
jgi:hypothetical protein